MVFDSFLRFSMVFSGFQWFSTVFNSLSSIHEVNTQGCGLGTQLVGHLVGMLPEHVVDTLQSRLSQKTGLFACKPCLKYSRIHGTKVQSRIECVKGQQLSMVFNGFQWFSIYAFVCVGGQYMLIL